MAKEGIELDVYDFADPTGDKLNTLDGRNEPASLTELKGVGGGSFKIFKSDAKVVAKRSLLATRNIVKTKVNGQVVGAMLINGTSSTMIDSGEEAAAAWAITGTGLKQWFNDAEVAPYGGLKANSPDSRSFSWASERGDWYVSGNWVAPHKFGPVLTTAPWTDAPDQWPDDAGVAQWIWQNYTTTAPTGPCYFRFEFTTTSDTSFNAYIAGDDYYAVFVDGAQLLASDPTSQGWVQAGNTQFTLPAGDHVFAIVCQNNGGAAAIASAIYKVDSTGVNTLWKTTNDSGWLINAYPAAEPGWSVGEIILTLLAEAEARGVLFPTWLTPTFTSTHDSDGNAWADFTAWTFDIGAKYDAVFSKMEEVFCDIWIDPDNFNLNVVAERGVDKSAFVYDVDGITVLASPIIFEKGKNLTQANTQSTGQMKNSLMMKTSNGWAIANDTDSQDTYGVLEDSITTNASPDVSAALATVLFDQYSTEEVGATYNIWPTGNGDTPFVNFNEGDWVIAPDDTGLGVKRQVMSLTTAETDTGAILYSAEFDTIFQDRATKIANFISNLGGSGIGSGSSNVTLNPPLFGGPVIVPTAPAPIKIPKAPTGLSASSAGLWSPDGVTAQSQITLTWAAVTENTDGTPMIPAGYEVWTHLSTVADEAFVPYATVPSNTATILPFVPGVAVVFEVRTIGPNRNSAFSSDFSYTPVGPTTPMDAPDTPTLSSSNGILTVTWDGKLAGATPPPQFRYVYAEVATSSGGTYVRMGAALTRDARQINITNLLLGDAYWVKLVAVDGANIPSAASSSANTTIIGVDLGSLDADVTDAIEAAQAAAIAAGSTNVQDPSFEANDITIWSLETANVTNTTSTPRSGLRNLEIKSTGSAYRASRYGLTYQCIDGDSFYMELYARAKGAGATVQNGIEIGVEYGTDASLGSYASIAGIPAGVTTTYTELFGTWQAPVGTRFVKPVISTTAADTTTINIYAVDDILFRKQISSALIVNGTIQTDDLAAGSVTAAIIAANAIAAANIQAGAVIAGKIAAGAVTANEIAASTITGDKFVAGAITAVSLASSVGHDLDISSNSSVTIIAGELSSTQSDLDSTNSNLETMQTYYTFSPSGALITSPGSPYAVNIKNDQIQMLQLGVAVSYWTAGVMYVASLVAPLVVLGNHQIAQFGTGTVVQGLT